MMKDYMKKIVGTICAASVCVMLAAASVCAADSARPMPGTDEAYTTSAGDQAVTGDLANTAGDTAANNVTTGTAAANNVTAAAGTNNTNKKYQSRLGGFLWFLLSVIVNFVISCWVGNRYYKLAKRNAQGSSEIRALRKDIEEKFASTLKDISEPAVEVINQNESYARTDEGLAMPERRAHIELSDEEREMVRRWDSKRSSSRTVQEDAEEEYEEEEYFEDEAEERSSKYSRSYQPTRRSSGIDFEEDDEDEEDEEDEDEYQERASQKSRPARMTNRRGNAKKSAKNATGKAKKFLNNVFPFDE